MQRVLVLVPAAAFLLLVLITVLRIALGVASQESYQIYAGAVRNWWSGNNPYPPGIQGFDYLPATIILFTPFALCGRAVGGVLWCLFSAGLYASGLYRMSRLLAPGHPWQVLGIAFIVVWFGAKANLPDGQAQVVMTGLLLHAAADLKLARWNRAAAELAIAVAFKPVAISVFGLAFVLYPSLRKPLLVALSIALLLPFLYPQPGMVLAVYHAALDKLLIAGQPPRGAWPWLADISTLLDALQIRLAVGGQLLLRALAAVTMLAIAIRARNVNQSSLSFMALALGLLYLTLFNPRCESVSYVALTPAIGVSAGLAITRESYAKLGWLLLAAGVALGVPWGKGFDPWLKPAIALFYFVLIAGAVLLRYRPAWLGDADKIETHG